jgi:ubiquinone/menaquinone biosynthesis C-methylase UbiE
MPKPTSKPYSSSKPRTESEFKKPRSVVTYDSNKPAKKSDKITPKAKTSDYSNKQKAFAGGDYKPKVYGNKTPRDQFKSNFTKKDEKYDGKSERETGWGSVANWYQKMVEDKDSYQNKVILPNLLKLLNVQKDETILDLGCGVGYFCEQYHTLGAKVIGVDIGIESIQNAQKNTNKEIVYHTNTAEKLPFITNSSVDKITVILAIQNIKFADKVIAEASRVLKKNGQLIVVMNHPYFRIPKHSSWEWSPKDWVQFRKIEKYLGHFESEIDMKPGEKDKSKKQITMSFHRPLEYYIQQAKECYLRIWRSGLVTDHLIKATKPKHWKLAEPKYLYLCAWFGRKFKSMFKKTTI